MFKTNEYFEGRVKSIAFTAFDGNATIGVMAAGEYTFNTTTVELMTVTCGEMQIRLTPDSEWRTYHAGETFRVEASQSFDVKTDKDTAYLCIYKE